MKKKVAGYCIGMLVLAGLTYAGAIKTWSSGETIKASDLNSTIAHIHNTMVGGHGARLVDADVAANAAIAATKVAGLQNAIDAGVQMASALPLVPKISGRFGTAGAKCTANPCALNYNIPTATLTSVSRSSTGVYIITYATARANITYLTFVQELTAGAFIYCKTAASSQTTTAVTVYCYDDTGTAADGYVEFLLIDDDAT